MSASPLLLSASRPFRDSIRCMRQLNYKGYSGRRKKTMTSVLEYREKPKYPTLEASAGNKGLPVEHFETDQFTPVDEFQYMKEKNYPFFNKITHRQPAPYIIDRSLPSAQINKNIYPIFPDNKSADAWPGIREATRARRLLPVPVSMTGLGLDDGQTAKYWTVKISNMIEKLEREIAHQDSDNLLENVTPAVRLLLDAEDSSELSLSRDHRELLKFYQEAKAKSLEPVIEEETPLVFPLALTTKIREQIDEEIILMQQQDQSLLDQEYSEYQKHRKVLEYFAKGLSTTHHLDNKDEFDSELEGWRDSFWRRSYGTPDPNVPVSKIPCGGCGALMHCVDPGLPGYLPSEKFTAMTNSDKKRSSCQRCEFLEHFNVSIDVTVPPDEYPAIISKIRENKSIVIMMVDMLDFPCSMWPDMMTIFGKNRKVFVVGNKVDLLPQDDRYHIDRMVNTLKKSLSHAGVHHTKNTFITNCCLISAKTGYGVEELISRLYASWNGQEDIYLIGCTNVGKSTLFNTLLQSDLCAVRENDLIQRATTSLWPGTTLSILKFPIFKMQGWQKEKRRKRLKKIEEWQLQETEFRKTLYRQTGHHVVPQILDRVGMTFRTEVPFTLSSSHPLAKKGAIQAPFNEFDDTYKHCRYFFDTPGTVYKEQILALLTTDELLKTIPRQLITPRVFSLQPYQTLFLAGLGRIDLIHSRQNVLLTVFASKYLPIHVTYTQEASRFYNMFLGSELLGVPIGSQERLRHFPPLVPKEIDLKGITWTESCADIVLSSAGWVSVTMGEAEECVLKAYTPAGKGIFVRQPSLLPFAVRMRGRRIVGTPCYETKVLTVNDFDEEQFPSVKKNIDVKEGDNEMYSYKAYQSRDFVGKIKNDYGWHEVRQKELEDIIK